MAGKTLKDSIYPSTSSLKPGPSNIRPGGPELALQKLQSGPLHEFGNSEGEHKFWIFNCNSSSFIASFTFILHQ